MSKRKMWTQDEIDTATEMLEYDKQWQEIADELERTYSSVRKKMGKLGYKQYNMSHHYEVGEVVGNGTLKILEKTTTKNSKQNKRSYIVQSLVYPNALPYETDELNLTHGSECAYKHNRRLCEENSLWSRLEFRDNIIDVEQAKKIFPSDKELRLFKCGNEECDHTKILSANYLISYYFYCDHCSKSTTYPELHFGSYVDVKNAGFLPQQTFDDFKGHIFDFVDYKNKIIVETHGEQHYEEGNGFMNHKRTVASDKRKRKYCKENNWTLIELDCRESDFEFIRNNINNEPLLEDITDNDVKGMLKIMELNKRYPVKEIIDLYVECMENAYVIAEKYNTTRGTIINILKKHNVVIRDSGSPKKKVKCLETNQTFESIAKAHEVTGIYRSGIRHSADKDHERKSAGGYHWEFVD